MENKEHAFRIGDIVSSDLWDECVMLWGQNGYDWAVIDRMGKESAWFHERKFTLVQPVMWPEEEKEKGLVTVEGTVHFHKIFDLVDILQSSDWTPAVNFAGTYDVCLAYKERKGK